MSRESTSWTSAAGTPGMVTATIAAKASPDAPEARAMESPSRSVPRSLGEASSSAMSAGSACRQHDRQSRTRHGRAARCRPTDWGSLAARAAAASSAAVGGAGVGSGGNSTCSMLADWMRTGSSTRSEAGPRATMASTTSMPSTTRPKMAYVRAASSDASASSSRTTKNWLPCEFGCRCAGHGHDAAAVLDPRPPRQRWCSRGHRRRCPPGRRPGCTKPGTTRWKPTPS